MTNQWLLIFRRVLFSAIFGAAISFALAQTFFGFDARVLIDKIFLVLVPALAVFICLMLVLPALEKVLASVSPTVRTFIFIWSFIATLLALLVTQFSLPLLSLLLIISLLLTIPAAPSVQTLLDAGGYRRAFGAWFYSLFFSFFIIGFLDNFYSSPLEVILLTLLLQAALGVGGYYLMGRIKRFAGGRVFDAAVYIVLFSALFAFIGWMFTVNQRVLLFPATYFVLNENIRWAFVFASLLALPWQAWMHIQLKFNGFYNWLNRKRVYSLISENLAGVALAFTFLVLYLLFASVINDPRFDVDDIFFDADGMNWRNRLVTDNWQDFYQRSVHPFVLLLLKPPVDLIAFFLKGNKLFSAYILVALGGALCIYLAWAFIKSATGNSVYASLIATLLGLTASHLIFGSLIESYIFLAASLLLFYVLLIKDKPLPALVAASLTTIGITHSNFAQNVIALFTVRPNIKQIIRFAATVIVFLVLLTVLNNLLYPNAHPFFFVPSSLQAEQQNLFPLNSLRIQALGRAFFFHNVVAPTPILYDQDIPFIQFRFFKPEIDALSQYDLPIQTASSWMWLTLLLFAGVLFLINLRKNPHLRLSLALMGCMALNLGLHLRYGKELFLYSPNWTYALILLVGLSWQAVSDRKWFQLVLLAFLILLMVNNGILLLGILDVLALQV